MNHEMRSSLDKHEQTTEPVDRFDRLLAAIVAEGETGWIELPGKWVKDPATSRSVPIQFWVFNPEPLSDAYETASYSPSLTLEIGRREYDGGGWPINKAKQYFVKRAYLDKSDPRYAEHKQAAAKALDMLERAYDLYSATSAA
jgi:hypothetical protein